MRRGQLLASAALLVCGPMAAQSQSNVKVMIPGWETFALLDTLGTRFDLAGPRDKVLAAIDRAFSEYELPPETVDRSMGRIPNRRVTKMRRLGKERLSRYLSCGQNVMGQNADTHRLNLAVVAWPEPAEGDVTGLRVVIAAAAQDPQGSRSEYAICVSRGHFEQEFVAKVKAALVVP